MQCEPARMKLPDTLDRMSSTLVRQHLLTEMDTRLGLLLQAIQKQPQTQVTSQSSNAELPLPETSAPDSTDTQQGQASSASEQTELSGVTSAKEFQAGVLSPAKRLALTYRSQKKMLLWDVVLSLQA